MPRGPGDHPATVTVAVTKELMAVCGFIFAVTCVTQTKRTGTREQLGGGGGGRGGNLVILFYRELLKILRSRGRIASAGREVTSSLEPVLLRPSRLRYVLV